MNAKKAQSSPPPADLPLPEMNGHSHGHSKPGRNGSISISMPLSSSVNTYPSPTGGSRRHLPSLSTASAPRIRLSLAGARQPLDTRLRSKRSLLSRLSLDAPLDRRRIAWLTGLATVLVILYVSRGEYSGVQRRTVIGLEDATSGVLRELAEAYHPHAADQADRQAVLAPDRPAQDDAALGPQDSDGAAEQDDEPEVYEQLEPAQIHDIDVRPVKHSPSGDPNERYLGYFPHSGYHNQRISLENALTLAKLLGRTLLLPPCWLGLAIPYISFDKLWQRVDQANKAGLERCARLADTDEIMPRECLTFFEYTQVGWDFLVDLEGIVAQQPVVDRWNTSEAWLRDELGLERKDMYFLKDATVYDYKIYDNLEDRAELEKFKTRIEIDQLRSYDSYRLLHIGSLFGTSRLRVSLEESYAARSLFRQHMVFRNPVLDDITDTIRDRLGGPAGYHALHLRVGDGIFLASAHQNCLDIFRTLLSSKMKIESTLIDQLIDESQRKRQQRVPGLMPRALDVPPSTVDVPTPLADDKPASSDDTIIKRSNSRPQDMAAYRHEPLGPLPRITSLENSVLAKSLRCRGSFHNRIDRLPLNTPLYLATDSRSPATDPNLAIFFDTFPCIFMLSDFTTVNAISTEAVKSLHDMEGLRNAEDKVHLAQFFTPLVDAMIAAKGRAVIGTPMSTFSRFAVDVLHQVAHGWPIIERG
ncbi:uncharacterized protein L969DRAFT_102198 [Mixia osmundae IAM 14324]|uniref:O-fucosyltransferase family protein n=1 Tax=Mixia osmundae (strain CBS 9802 / IAM 14324 / JCM 22182 / KY 12970) TaxID=764103 RepID=G7E5M0_MIXOS|nr:uncharacterized protein L969DRAFT_102198 [Mixia osmundae IAM 14324]KEI40722.1 hypothetical protein L969DRAFT_102198 [Mixia osmundae IAM 14324]GAA98130.1 hypothetical protein E5Q_04813 [Mixia osmundae IAM 14324]